MSRAVLLLLVLGTLGCSLFAQTVKGDREQGFVITCPMDLHKDTPIKVRAKDRLAAMVVGLRCTVWTEPEWNGTAAHQPLCRSFEDGTVAPCGPR